MMKKAQSSKMRCLAVALVSLFALLAQLFLLPQKASAIEEDKITAFQSCMEMPLDKEGAERDEQAQAINDCVSPIGLAWGEAEALCSDEEYQKGVNIEKCNAILGRRVKTDPESLGERQEGAVTPLDNKCVSSNRAVAWFGCSIIDSTSNTITRTYSSIVEDWLVFDPEILSGGTNPTGTATYKVWSAIRGLANIVLLILIIIIIYAHVTGIQVQAYGLKKSAPKLVITAILMNLSYYICQIAVDLCNILGSRVGDFFIKQSEKIDLTTVTGFAGMSGGTGVIVIVIIVLVGLIVGLLATGPAIFIPVLMTIVGGMLTIFFTYAMLVIRQALMIMMIVVSPIAIAFSALPNTMPIYRKWFNLSRGLLLTYPLATLLIYGGNYAGRVILKTWDSNGLIPVLVSMAVCILPVTMLPKIAQSSIAAIDRMMLKAQNGINGFAKGRIADNRFADRANEIKRQKQTRRAAGVRYDKKTGELKSVVPSKLRTASMDYNLAAAEKDASYERHIGFMKGNNKESFDALAFNTELKAVESQLDAQGQMSVQDMQAQLAAAGGSSARDSAMAFALSKRMFASGEAGRDALRETMRAKAAPAGGGMGPAGVNTAWNRSVCSAIASYGDEGKGFDPALMDYATSVTNGTVSAATPLQQYTPSPKVYSGLSGEKLAKMDTSALRELHSNLGGMYSSGDAATIAQADNIVNSAGRLLQSTDTAKLTMEQRRIIDQINKAKT